MGKRGPKPKPTALRVFEGDPGRLLAKRHGEAQPGIPDAVPQPPEWLGKIGKAKWRELAPHLYPIGLLTAVDVDALALYCEAWDELFAMRALIDESGAVAVSEKGGEYQHPAVGIKNKAIQRIKQFGALFGVGPATRVGLNVAPPNESDDLESLGSVG